MSTTNRANDRDDRGYLKRSLRGPNIVMTTPGFWVRMNMNRPRRRENRHLCHLVKQGQDSDGMNWPVGSRKPHIYYW